MLHYKESSVLMLQFLGGDGVTIDTNVVMSTGARPLPWVALGWLAGLSRGRSHNTVAVNNMTRVIVAQSDNANGRNTALSWLRRRGRGTKNVLHNSFQGNVRSMSLAWGSTSQRQQNPTSALPSAKAPTIPPDQEPFSNFCPQLFLSCGCWSLHVKLRRREISRNIFISIPSNTPAKINSD